MNPRPDNPDDTDDELARKSAVKYAAATVHYVRRITRYISEMNPTVSVFEKVANFDPDHTGKPPIEADVLAQQRLEEVVEANPPSQQLGDVVFLGEEVAKRELQYDKDVRHLIVRSDPIDGTSNMSHCGDGFSSVVTIDQWVPELQKWQHMAGSIIRNDGDGISWSNRSVHRHNVVIDFRDLSPRSLPRIIDRPPIPNFKRWRLSDEWREKLAYAGATVAAHRDTRRSVLVADFPDLIRKPDFLDFRSGSASAWGLCNRRLGFVFEMNATTIHDSAHLYPFTYLGGEVVDHAYQPIDVAEIFEANAGPDGEVKAVPPYIAFVDSRSLEFLREILGTRHVGDFGESATQVLPSQPTQRVPASASSGSARPDSIHGNRRSHETN